VRCRHTFLQKAELIKCKRAQARIMRNGCRKTLRGWGEKREMMVADFTRPISERAQPDAYKLVARYESLYILIAADDSRVAALFLSFFYLPINSSPLSLISFRLSFPNIQTHATHQIANRLEWTYLQD